MSFRACVYCGRVAMGRLSRCNRCWERGALLPSDRETTSHAFLALAVLALVSFWLLSLDMPEPTARAHDFAPSWSGERPAAIQLAGVREQRSSTK